MSAIKKSELLPEKAISTDYKTYPSQNYEGLLCMILKSIKHMELFRLDWSTKVQKGTTLLQQLNKLSVVKIEQRIDSCFLWLSAYKIQIPG